MSVAFKVFWRVKGKEWLVNNFVAIKSPFTYSNDNANIYLEDFPLDATHVDVILRSSVELAEKYNACTRIWQGEIVIPDQQLEIIEDKK